MRGGFFDEHCGVAAFGFRHVGKGERQIAQADAAETAVNGVDEESE